MSLPVSWLSAAALPAVPKLGETAKNLTSSTAQAFGNLLQNLTSPANGPSELNSTPNQPKLAGPRERDPNDPDSQIKTRLSELISRVKKKLGLGSTEQNVTVLADGWGIPKVEGNPLLNTHVQSQLEQDPDLIALMNQRARSLSDPYSLSTGSQFAGDPLRWLPQSPLASNPAGRVSGLPSEDATTNGGFYPPVAQPGSSALPARWTILG